MRDRQRTRGRVQGGGEGRAPQTQGVRDAVARVRQGSAAGELLLPRLASARGRSMRFQVECVLLLFDDVGPAPRPSSWRDAERSALGSHRNLPGAWMPPGLPGRA
jgi:hypothetical protein